MPITPKSLGIEGLSVRERLELIDQLWDSLPESIEPQDVPEWHLVELAQRRAEMESRPGVGRPWRDVLELNGTRT